ncbi:hypothetical protein HN51_031516 [Arachis hypogaea]
MYNFFLNQKQKKSPFTIMKAIIGKNKKKQYNRYSNLLYNMYKGQLLLNRKIVAQMGILKGNCLQKINRIKLLICMKSFLFSWMKSFESLEFVNNYRQYRLYFLWDVDTY